MKKIVKIIGAAGAVALAASLVPYRFKSDKESGSYELGGLLWNLKKTRNEDEDTYTMELLPFVDKEKPEEETVEAEVEIDTEAAPEEPVEEPFAEEATNDVVVEEVDTSAQEPVEEPFAEQEPELAVEHTDSAAAEEEEPEADPQDAQ